MTTSAEDQSLKRLALITAVACVRNTCIEDFHARPGGLTDADMRMFNKQVADKLYTFLRYLLGADMEKRRALMAAMEPLCPVGWDEPSLDKGMVAAVEGAGAD